MLRALLFLLAFGLVHHHSCAAEAAAEDLAPPETIFFLKVTDVTSFYGSFIKDHMLSLANPIVAETIKNGAQNSVMNVPPAPMQVPLAFEASELLYTAVTRQLFLACVFDDSGNSGFISGGKSPAPAESIAKLRTEISSKIPGAWMETKVGEITASALTIPGIGSVTLCSSGDWVLLGTSLPAMTHALSAIGAPGKGLSSIEIWKINMANLPSDVSLQYFSRLEAFERIAGQQKATSVANLFKRRLHGLRAFSWSYKTAGPGSIALDFFSYTFRPEAAKALQASALPLGEGWRPLSGPNTVAILASKLDLAKLGSAAFLQGMPVQKLLVKSADFLGDAASPMHAAFIVDHLPETHKSRSAFVVRAEGAGIRAKLSSLSADQIAASGENFSLPGSAKMLGHLSGSWWLADSNDSLTYFSDRKPSPTSALLAATDSLPAAPNPFIDLRLDRQKIADDLTARLISNYAHWSPILQKRGVALPDVAPEIDLQAYLGPLRSTLGISGENLILINSFQLGSKTGSTLMTASSLVAQVAFHDDINRFRIALNAVFQPESKALAEEEADFFHVCFWTNHFCGPLLPPNQNSIFSDLVSQFFLAAPEIKD